MTAPNTKPSPYMKALMRGDFEWFDRYECSQCGNPYVLEYHACDYCGCAASKHVLTESRPPLGAR